MSNKFRPPGYHPIQQLKVILAGLHIAVVIDFSVAYKVVLSVPVLGGAFLLRLSALSIPLSFFYVPLALLLVAAPAVMYFLPGKVEQELKL